MTAVPRGCMRVQIRDAIVSRILSGAYPPGARLKELTLAREFKVSQAPVREALRELEALHLVETQHYRGTRVRSIDFDELHEAYELRLLIEQAAVRRAPPCAGKDLAELEDELKGMYRLARNRDFDGYMAAVVRFHRKLVEMSGNRLFLRVWESMAWDVRARVACKRIGLIGLYTEQRKQLLSALRSRDGEKAAAILAEITQRLRARLAGMQEEAILPELARVS